jgi:cysteine synthase
MVGVSRALRARGCRARIVALEPASSPVLTTGKGGAHRVEGIGVGFRPPHLKDSDFDEVRAVDEEKARAMARRLAKEKGIFAGTSSALNVFAALQLAQTGTGKDGCYCRSGQRIQILCRRFVSTVENAARSDRSLSTKRVCSPQVPRLAHLF